MCEKNWRNESDIRRTEGSRSKYTALGTYLPLPDSLKKVLKASGVEVLPS